MDDHLKRKKYPTAILKSSMLLKQQIQKLKVLFNGESQPQRLWNTFYFLKYWQKNSLLKRETYTCIAIKPKRVPLPCYFPSLTFIYIFLLLVSVGNLIH